MAAAGRTSYGADLPVAMNGVSAQGPYDRLNAICLLRWPAGSDTLRGRIVAMLSRHDTAGSELVIDGDNVVASCGKLLRDLDRTALEGMT